ncbi:MAG: pyridoxamine 5'-phosphate oxidase family protein [Sporichthya sp.]|nr:pyridoxamine 5'-phosphate oxidase family protein [Sporichthya sp.]
MLAPAHLFDGAVRFLAGQHLAALSARDRDGRLWVSALEGPEGLLEASATKLLVHTSPRPGDPLHGLPAGQPVGLLAIEFATRRRFRLNGTLTGVGDDLEIELAYGNCPKYIHPRKLTVSDAAGTVAAPGPSTTLSAGQVELIRSADTFFLGTTHPDRGNDASHRGGPAGFVGVEGNTVWWPDYVGNDMFNSFGNLAVDDTAALLFPDFATGRTLHLSGRASVVWDAPTETGRAVRFTVEQVVEGPPLLQRTP